MKKNTEQCTLNKLLNNIEKRPGIVGMANNEKRLDYLCYFLNGWFINNKSKISARYCKEFAHYIHSWIMRENKISNIDFSFLWYKMIYKVTETEEEAWKLFFKMSYEYIDKLEAEENQ